MKVSQTKLPGVLIFEPQVFGDDRGFFIETFNYHRYAEAGLDRKFLQDNHSRSSRSVLRGLHYQLNNPQGKSFPPKTVKIPSYPARPPAGLYGLMPEHQRRQFNHP